jgi:hypothetical protein
VVYTAGSLTVGGFQRERERRPDTSTRRWLDWIVSTCLLHGATLFTAFTVAGLFTRGLDQ